MPIFPGAKICKSNRALSNYLRLKLKICIKDTIIKGTLGLYCNLKSKLKRTSNDVIAISIWITYHTKN